jgi:predicted O-linked N-acetylglucosamine transferase (SPINDLY family)
MTDPSHILQQAVAFHQRGELQQASAAYQQVLRLSPSHPIALHHLGMLELQARRYDQARALLNAAASAAPAAGGPHFHLGELAKAQGNAGLAMTEYRRAIALQPDLLVAYHSLAELLMSIGRPAEAVVPLTSLVKAAPELSGSWMLLAKAQLAVGQREAAIKSFERVVELYPMSAEARHFMAQTLIELGQPAEAIEPLLEAREIEPDNPAIHAMLARAYTAMNQHTEALPHYQRAVELLPDADAALNNYGVALHRAGKIGEAETQLRQAVAKNPASANALTNLASVLREQGRAGEARECYQQAMQLRPESSAINSIYLYTLHFDPDCDGNTIAAEHRKWAQRHLSQISPVQRKSPVERNPDRKLRVGYISADFRQHVVGRFIEPIMACHDRNRFEIVCYSDTVAVDDLTGRLKQSDTLWRETVGLSDQQLAQQVADDAIDILLDTTGHMDANRLGVFARSPAPVQISHIGYPASSGVPQIRFRITDGHLDPTDSVLSPEMLLRMPESFYLYANSMRLEPAEHPPMMQNGFVTFGSLNAFAKTSGLAIQLWASVLDAVPGSKFLLAVPPDLSVNAWVHQRFADHGIDPSRLILEPTRSFDAYLKLYDRIDIVLDPQPYGGGITSCDALWMGVPIVTLKGKTSVGRIGASILNAVGLGDWVADDTARYAAIAAENAGEVQQLKTHRRSLRDRLARSPLMNAPSYTANLEQLFLHAWHTGLHG